MTRSKATVTPPFSLFSPVFVIRISIDSQNRLTFEGLKLEIKCANQVTQSSFVNCLSSPWPPHILQIVFAECANKNLVRWTRSIDVLFFSPQGRFTSDSHVSKTTSVHQHHCIIICIKPEDKDCPPGAEFTVDNVKGGNICGTCTYVHRGSFEKYTVNAFIEQLEKCVPLEDKSLSRSLFTRLVRYIIFGVFLIHVAACA